MLARSCGPLSPLPLAGSAPPQAVRLAGEDMVANLEWISCPPAQNCRLNCLQARRKEEALVWNGRNKHQTRCSFPKYPGLHIFPSFLAVVDFTDEFNCLELLTFKLSPGPDPLDLFYSVFVGDEIIFIYWHGGFVAFTLHLKLMIALVFFYCCCNKLPQT